ncbi:MAG: hypothetical protein HONDAALG_00904 [Gammaproteobacteria bacterium]|nr:hypothetical protein [Gammaproteobacteria bacterium]
MNKGLKRALLFAVAAIAAVFIVIAAKPRPRAADAWSPEHQCHIVNGMKTIIDRPGTYCLLSDIEIGQASIDIKSSDVVLDLHGHRLARDASQPVAEPAIRIGNVADVRIRNGVIEDVHIGITSSGAENLTIESVRFSNIGFIAAIVADGKDVALLNNVVERVGYHDRSMMPDDSEAYAVGFNVRAEDALIKGNTFRDVRRQPTPESAVGEGVAVIISSGSSAVRIESNAVELVPQAVSGSIGIWLGVDSTSEIRANLFRNVERGIAGREANARIEANRFVFDAKEGSTETYGIYLVYADEASRVTDNVISGYAQPVTGTGRDGKTPLEMPDNTIQ